MRILCGLLLIFAFTALPGAKAKDKASAETIVFPHQESDLKPDPAARFGRLANGVRYVVLSNREPSDRASLRLLVLAGSLHEKEDQRGLAHFLEHMAFNGSKHYPPGKLIEFFQRMGMSFGADVNANTSFDRTIYHLELAHADDATVTEGMRVFSDYAGGLLLTRGTNRPGARRHSLRETGPRLRRLSRIRRAIRSDARNHAASQAARRSACRKLSPRRSANVSSIFGTPGIDRKTWSSWR